MSFQVISKELLCQAAKVQPLDGKVLTFDVNGIEVVPYSHANDYLRKCGARNYGDLIYDLSRNDSSRQLTKLVANDISKELSRNGILAHCCADSGNIRLYTHELTGAQCDTIRGYGNITHIKMENSGDFCVTIKHSFIN
jgi:hypothetical protein